MLTTILEALYLITFPVRIIGWLAIGALDNLAVRTKLRWRDSRGNTHWNGEL